MKTLHTIESNRWKFSTEFVASEYNRKKVLCVKRMSNMWKCVQKHKTEQSKKGSWKMSSKSNWKNFLVIFAAKNLPIPFFPLLNCIFFATFSCFSSLIRRLCACCYVVWMFWSTSEDPWIVLHPFHPLWSILDFVSLLSFLFKSSSSSSWYLYFLLRIIYVVF